MQIQERLNSERTDYRNIESLNALRKISNADLNTVNKIKSDLARINDAKEEMSIAFSERLDSASSEIEGDFSKPHRFNLSTDDLRKYLLQANSKFNPKTVIAEFGDLIKSVGDLEGYFKEKSLSAAEQLYLIREFLRYLENSGDHPELRETFQYYEKKIEATKEDEIYAELNTIGAVVDSNLSPQRTFQFQCLYKQVVLQQLSVEKLLNKLLAETVTENFSEQLNLLICAVGSDLGSSRPSTDKPRLIAISSDLFSLQVINTVLQSSQLLLSRMKNEDPFLKISPHNYLSNLISFATETSPSSSIFKRFLNGIGITNLSTQIYIQTAIIQDLRKLPVRIYRGDSERVAVLQTAQSVLDALVATE